MKTITVVLAVLAGLLLTPIAVENVQKVVSHTSTKETINQVYEQQALPPQTEALEMSLPKIVDVKKTINLEDSNTVVFKGPVTEESVSVVMRKLQKVSRRISKDTPIYLVLDTPGGDIFAGMDLIDLAKALPQKVHTVSLFAASMGFQIAQNLDNRYIIRSGTLMSHRATVGKLSGQVKGELESRYKSIRRAVDILDSIAAKRMGLDLKTYENKIFNELWVYGYDALEEKVADETVLVSCGESMSGSYSEIFKTMFGPVRVTFNKCPLIKAPEAIEFQGLKTKDAAEKLQVETSIRDSFTNQKKFVNEFIVTDRFHTIFK